MKWFLLSCFLAAGLGAEEAAPADAALPPSDRIASSQAEASFQEARRAYLAGDRDASWKALNQALALEPFHTGAGKLYQTLKEEEKSLRQLRLAGPEKKAELPLYREDARPRQAAPADSQSARLWTALRALEKKLDQRFNGAEQSLSNLEGSVNTLRAQGEGQRQLGTVLHASQQKLETRQDWMLMGLFGLCLLMILVLLWLLRLVLDTKSEVEKVETSLSGYSWRKKR